MGKVPINVRADGAKIREMEEILESPNSPFKDRSELIRECLYEGIHVVKKRVMNGGKT